MHLFCCCLPHAGTGFDCRGVFVRCDVGLQVLDIHNCEISEATERAVVAKFSDASSKLYLLGSHYGRQDHRIGALDKDWVCRTYISTFTRPVEPRVSFRFLPLYIVGLTAAHTPDFARTREPISTV